MIRAGRLVLVAGAVVFSSLAALAGDARAAPLTVTLEYASSPGCPDAADFKAVVIARLGYDPFTDGASDHVLVDIQRRGSAIDGRIEWRDFSGRWTGDQSFPSVSTDCPRLVRAMGFALAVQIQLLAKANAVPGAEADAPPARSAAPEAAAVAKPPTAPAPEPPAVARAAAVAPPASGAEAPVFAMGAGPSVGLGMSSGPVLLGRLFGALAWRHISIELAGVASLPATTRRSDGAGFSQQFLLGSAAACAAVTRWNGCLMANAGAVRMIGEIDQPTSATVPIVEVGIRAGLTQRLGRFISLAAHADGLVNVTRWTGRLDQLPVWTAPRFAAALGVDARVQFR